MALVLTLIPMPPAPPRPDPFLVRQRAQHLDEMVESVREACTLAPSTELGQRAWEDIDRAVRAWPQICQAVIGEQGACLRHEQVEDAFLVPPPALPRDCWPVLAQWAEALVVQRAWEQAGGAGLSPTGRLREFERRLRERRGQLEPATRGLSWRWWCRRILRVQSTPDDSATP